MSDLPETYLEEIRLSRELACALEGVKWSLNREVYHKFLALKRHYERQQEEGVQ